MDLYHSYCSEDIKLRVRPQCPDLLSEDVDDNEGSCPSQSSRTVHSDGPRTVCREIHLKHGTVRFLKLMGASV